jgi:outer membrane protein OmpA-like peptidoglycan-associated protein
MHRRFVISGALGALMLLAAPGHSQGIFGKIKDRARTEVDRKENDALDAMAKAVTCAITDKTCIKKAHDAGEPVKVTDKNGKPVSSADSAAAISAAVAQAASLSDDPSVTAPAAGAPAAAAPAAPPANASSSAVGSGAWANYDFVPGSRTIFYEDFSGDAVGDFPARMKLSDGNLEVATVKGAKVLRVSEAGVIFIVLPEKLPDRFTVEAVYHSPTTAKPMAMYTGGNKNRFGCFPSSAYVDAEAKSGMKGAAKAPAGFVSCRFTVDTRYVRGYIDSARTSNAPGVTIARTDTLYLAIPDGTDKDPTLLASIRIADAGTKLYDVLSTKGRVTTHGIAFDEGTDHIRGESTPTLAEIADMLKTHGPLSVTIEDHADNAGMPAASKTLSEKRAAAVKQQLVSKYGIASTRIKTAGLGGSKPVSPNTTAEGRQNNRRIDLVKL